MKVLLAGPGTGKTTNIKGIIEDEYNDVKSILVLSFTNATVNDLNESFIDNDTVICRTLHSYAMSINPLTDSHILHQSEIKLLEKLSTKLEVEFNTLCEQLNCTTFSNMISACISFIKNNPTYVKDVVGEIDLLIVDEFQDFNELEQELIFELEKLSNECLILGDDDQSIYGFKDADPNVLIGLHNNQQIPNLEHEHNCYRCPDCVVDISSNLINKNRNRVSKPWNRIGKDGNVYIDQIEDSVAVNTEILSRITDIQENDLGSIMILSPMRYPLISVVAFLIEKEIPIVNFISAKIPTEILERIWILRAVFSSKKVLNLLFYFAHIGQHTRKGFQNIIKDGLNSNINDSSVISKLLDLDKISEPLKSFVLSPPSLEEFEDAFPEYSNLIDLIDDEDIEESVSKLTKEIAPTPEVENDKVNIMTIHKSKGLGADNVFILGAVQGILPNSKLGINTIEAQRRLLFVALTRAKKTLHIISQVNWAGQFVNTVNKDEFNYNWRKKTYQGRMSEFVEST